MDLVARILALHESLTAAQLPHAFGGALALAWCTARARGTIDIDVNILIPTTECDKALQAMPTGMKITPQDRKILKRDGQVRLWWDKTPVDLFLNSTPFHEAIIRRVRYEAFAGANLPFLSCQDLAVFKAFFNRTKDWADLEEMKAAGTLDVRNVTATLIEYLGADDERIAKLGRL
ncbi:MAG TPA: hypothetical protein PLF22_11545 [Pseudomonadales bacterium]|nr:hypothetical protein [Pseudomonadales bacterium]